MKISFFKVMAIFEIESSNREICKSKTSFINVVNLGSQRIQRYNSPRSIMQNHCFSLRLIFSKKSVENNDLRSFWFNEVGVNVFAQTVRNKRKECWMTSKTFAALKTATLLSKRTRLKEGIKICFTLSRRKSKRMEEVR